MFDFCQNVEFDYIHETIRIVDSASFSSMKLINDPASINGLEKDLMITHSIYESSKLFQSKELVKIRQ